MADRTPGDMETFFVSRTSRAVLGGGMLLFVGMGVWHLWGDATFDVLLGLTQLVLGVGCGWGLWQSFYVPLMTISADMLTYRSLLPGKPKSISLTDCTGISGETAERLYLRRLSGHTTSLSLLGIAKRDKPKVRTAIERRLPR